MRLTQGSLVAGRYNLERRIGRGGMSVLWCAHDRQLDARVAVKALSPMFADSAKMLARFEREAKSAARLRSPHIVAVRDYGVHEGEPYIVMELLDGEDLEHRLKRVVRMGPSEAHDIVKQVALGLECAHAEGIVHRDLKPANVFLARAGTHEFIKILDFGIAKVAAPISDTSGEHTGLTETGALLGTPQYMSPEQALGTPTLDRRSDVWSLAMIVFRMLTGRNAVQADTAGKAIVDVVSGSFLRVTEVAPDLPPGLGPFFDRAFADDIDARHQSALELYEDLLVASGARASNVPRSLPPIPASAIADLGVAPTIMGTSHEVTAEPVRRAMLPRAVFAAGAALLLIAGGALAFLVNRPTMREEPHAVDAAPAAPVAEVEEPAPVESEVASAQPPLSATTATPPVRAGGRRPIPSASARPADVPDFGY